MTYQARVITGGKVVIPADLRRELGIKDGDALVVERDPSGGIVFKTYAQVVDEVQARFRSLRTGADGAPTDVVDELLTERREEGRRAASDVEAWVAAQR